MNNALRLAHLFVRPTSPVLDSSVVICHGLFGSKQNWKSLSNAFAQRGCGSVITPDLRNHGISPHSEDMSYISMSQDVIKLIGDLRLTNVCAVGHSMGGKVVMCAALTEPEKITKLVVIDSSPTFSSPAQQIVPYVNLMLSTDLYKVERECDGTLTGMRQALMDEWKEAVPEESMRLFLLTNLEQQNGSFNWRVNLKAIQSCWHQIIGFPRDELKSKTFDGPTLFVAGGRSNYIRPSELPTLRHYFPKARLFSVTNAGHWVHVDAPQAVLDLVSAFIKDAELPQMENVVEL